MDAVQSAHDIDLSKYNSFIVGDSVHAGQYHGHVLRFIKKNSVILDSKPNAFFSVCMAAASTNESEREAAAKLIDNVVKQTHWTPQRRAVFAGALMYSQYGFFKRFLMRRIAAAEGGDTDTSHDYEYTDWTQVERFADEFANQIATLSDS